MILCNIKFLNSSSLFSFNSLSNLSFHSQKKKGKSSTRLNVKMCKRFVLISIENIILRDIELQGLILRLLI